MTRSYLRDAPTARETPQDEPIPGSTQEPNAGGGYGWAVGPMERLRRFLILGAEGGTYYVGERTHVRENVAAVRDALDEFGVKAVAEIVEISEQGRAIKNDEALYALAMACAHKDDETRRAALDAIPRVARTATHLFQFCTFVEGQRGWGRALKRAVAAWYLRDAGKVAFQAVKYRSRDVGQDGPPWTHDAVLRLVKPGTVADVVPIEHRILFEWIAANGGTRTDKLDPDERAVLGLPPLSLKYPRSVDGSLESCAEAVTQQIGVGYGEALDKLTVIEAYERAQAVGTPKETVALIEEYGSLLPWEAIQSDHMKDVAVTEALVRGGMPLGALTRQLGRMTANDALKPMGDLAQFVAERFSDGEAIEKSRLHPMSILKALRVYREGKGQRGRLSWSPVREIVDALDAAFYLAFGNVPKTGKRTMLALDVSASMEWPQNRIGGMAGMTAREAAAAMSLVQANVGDPYMVTAFSAPMGYNSYGYGGGGRESAFRRSSRGGMANQGIEELDFSPRQRLDDVIENTRRLYAAATDCALPMLYALGAKIEIDTFVIYTDNETNAGHIHPKQALDRYRETMGIPARLVTVAMSSGGSSIADPEDAGMLDVVGFDTDAPAMISAFSGGEV